MHGEADLEPCCRLIFDDALDAVSRQWITAQLEEFRRVFLTLGLRRKVAILVALNDTLELLERARVIASDHILSVIVLDGGRWNAASAAEWLSAGAEQVVFAENNYNLVPELSGRIERLAEVDRLLESPKIKRVLKGSSPCWMKVMRKVAEVAHFAESFVMLTGESGTGKELVARAIHELDSARNDKTFNLLDCTTINPTLSGSEFFGHERGAFTDARVAREGVFGLADGGTLFLDEIGELDLVLQAQLLRVIQEGTFKRVGGNTWIKTKFRLITATNRDLREEVRMGRFRRDLYYRISAWEITLPPLRERTADIPELAEHFVETFARPKRLPKIDPALMDYLCSRHYEGNVRDLKQLISRAMDRFAGGDILSFSDLAESDRPQIQSSRMAWPDDALKDSLLRALTVGVDLKTLSKSVGKLYIETAFAGENRSSNGDKSLRRKAIESTAKRLGCSPRWVDSQVSNGSDSCADDGADEA